MRYVKGDAVRSGDLIILTTLDTEVPICFERNNLWLVLDFLNQSSYLSNYSSDFIKCSKYLLLNERGEIRMHTFFSDWPVFLIFSKRR